VQLMPGWGMQAIAAAGRRVLWPGALGTCQRSARAGSMLPGHLSTDRPRRPHRAGRRAACAAP
jgi:hypothetical protein